MKLSRFTVDYRIRKLGWPRDLAETLPPGVGRKNAPRTVAYRVRQTLADAPDGLTIAELHERLPDASYYAMCQAVYRLARVGMVDASGPRRRGATQQFAPVVYRPTAALLSWAGKGPTPEPDEDGWTPPKWVHPYRRTAA